MTATWHIARGRQRCQFDFHLIPEGEPYQRVTHSRVTRKFQRCEQHALVPADQSAIDAAYAEDERVQEKNAIDAAEAVVPSGKVIRVRRTIPLKGFSAIGEVFDPRLAQLGERDR